MNTLPLLFSLFAPFAVWPIEKIFPYPYIIEEIGKAVIVFFGSKDLSIKDGIKQYILCGFLFSLTETVFYSTNIGLSGQLNLYLIRIVTTTILHSATFTLLFLTYKKNAKLMPAGLFAAGILHFLYNLFI